jgi:PQQ-dependent dehydrogenase (s-GDH family)
MKCHHCLKHLLFFVFFSVSIKVISQPVNNLCAGATILPVTATCGAVAGQSLYLASSDGLAANGFGPTYDVWYKFTATSTAVQISLSGTGGSITNTNTYIEAFNSVNCGGISTASSIGIATRQNGLTITDMAVGTVYYFRVFANVNPNSSAAQWAFSICLATTLTAPGNDACGTPTVLTVGTVLTTARVAGATPSAGITVGCALGTPDDDVWFQFTATSTTHNIIVNPNPDAAANPSAAGTTLASSGAMLQLFSGACASLTSIACGDRGAIYATGLTVGTVYRVRVYSFGTFGTNPNATPTNAGLNFNILVTTAAPVIPSVSSSRMNEVFRQTLLSPAGMLNDPWEVTYGPDGYLWITEAKGYRIVRMDPNTGARTTVLDIGRNSNFFTTPADKAYNMQFELAYANPQGGLAGLAIHPAFMDAVTPKKYVYVSYIQDYGGGVQPTGIFYTNSIVRFTYNTSTGKLESPVTVCDTIPGSSDHNSQRMIIAPVGGTDYLFYGAGDMGAGQFGNRDRIEKAQMKNSYEGKILRFNLETDGDAGLNGFIPNTNPYNATLGVQSAVWAMGIRNNQGFVYDSTRKILYGSSHGPYSDDEINIIDSNKNYGHPLVIGYSSDHNVDGSSAGAAPGMNPPGPALYLPTIGNEVTNANTIGSSYRDPIFSAYPSSVAFPSITNLYNTTTGANAQWPSEGWSGLDLYNNSIIPGWKQSLVASSLKWGRLVKIRLQPSGTAVLNENGKDTISYFGSTNRFRDVAVAPNGKDLYVVMDRSTTSSGPSAGNPIVPACGGCVQKYTFLGYADNGSGSSTIPNTIKIASGINNQCENANTIVINSANNNLNIWVPITDTNSNVIAEIYSTVNLDTVRTSMYHNGGPVVREDGGHRLYADRNITITPQTQPVSPVKIRLYLTTAEFTALNTALNSQGVGSGIGGSINNVGIFKNSNNTCVSSLSGGTATAVTTNVKVAHGTLGYVLQANSLSSFSTFYFANSLLTTLPVQLLAFTGNLVDNATLLNWSTSSEINTANFIVERSEDGNNFSSIGTVAAAGNSNSPLSYSYTDNDVMTLPSSVIYYRLKIVDKDGNFVYSKIVTISLADLVAKVTVFPNPATDKTNITVGAVTDGQVHWRMIDNAGRTVMASTVQVKKGRNNITVNVTKLAAGIYHLTVSGAGVEKQVKFQKY